MSIFTEKRLIMVLAFLLSITNLVNAQIIFDGVSDGDSYSNSAKVSWYNAHKTEFSVYKPESSYVTSVLYGVSGGFSYLFVEAPIFAKNMIWDNSGLNLTESDLSPYRGHHDSHHDPEKLKLNYKTAVESEKVAFTGDDIFNLTGKSKTDLFDDYGLVAFKSSLDFLLDNNLADDELSLNRDRTMSFEFKFNANFNELEALVSNIQEEGIEFHLSDERRGTPVINTPVPEPSTYLMLSSFLGIIMVITYRRKKRPSSPA